jgi:aminopeptidase N
VQRCGHKRATILALFSRLLYGTALAFIAVASFVTSQVSPPTPQSSAAPRQSRSPRDPTRADLRGGYGPYRANNDPLFYHLDIHVDPEKKFIAGKNTIRFKMLKGDSRIQLDLSDALKIDKILFRDTQLKYERDSGAVFLDFPTTLRAGQGYSIDFYYSGSPTQTGRFDGFTFGRDSAGHPWIYTACEGVGASIWWPNKDQWCDEVENMQISVSIANGLVDVSNGKFMGKTDLGDGYTRWDWFPHYPINNYDVSLNIGNYRHFSDRLRGLPMDFYALPEDLDKAKSNSARPKGCSRLSSTTSASTHSRKTAISWLKCPTPGWSIRAR